MAATMERTYSVSVKGMLGEKSGSKVLYDKLLKVNAHEQFVDIADRAGSDVIKHEHVSFERWGDIQDSGQKWKKKKKKSDLPTLFFPMLRQSNNFFFLGPKRRPKVFAPTLAQEIKTSFWILLWTTCQIRRKWSGYHWRAVINMFKTSTRSALIAPSSTHKKNKLTWKN